MLMILFDQIDQAFDYVCLSFLFFIIVVMLRLYQEFDRVLKEKSNHLDLVHQSI